MTNHDNISNTQIAEHDNTANRDESVADQLRLEEQEKSELRGTELRDTLFRTLRGLADGSVSCPKANAIAALSKQILDSFAITRRQACDGLGVEDLR